MKSPTFKKYVGIAGRAPVVACAATDGIIGTRASAIPVAAKVVNICRRVTLGRAEVVFKAFAWCSWSITRSSSPPGAVATVVPSRGFSISLSLVRNWG